MTTKEKINTISDPLFFSPEYYCEISKGAVSSISLKIKKLNKKVGPILGALDLPHETPLLFDLTMSYQEPMRLSEALLETKYNQLQKNSSSLSSSVYNYFFGDESENSDVMDLLSEDSKDTATLKSLLMSGYILWTLDSRFSAMKCQMRSLLEKERTFGNQKIEETTLLASLLKLENISLPATCTKSDSGILLLELPVEEDGPIPPNRWAEIMNIWSTDTFQLVPKFVKSGKRVRVTIADRISHVTAADRMNLQITANELGSNKVLAHELGHLIGFQDCYAEYVDSKTRELVYFELDSTNLMCSMKASAPSKDAMNQLMTKYCK